jgi:hypothetical protein
VPTPTPPLPYVIPDVEIEVGRPTATGSMRAQRAQDAPHTLPGWIAAIIYLGCAVVMVWAILRML